MTDAAAVSAPKYGPRLARLYSEDVRRLEALHANGLAPGAKTWDQAIEMLFRKLTETGPVKGAKLIGKAIDYLNGVDKDARRHFMVASQRRSRSAYLMFATFAYGNHPDPAVREEGLAIDLHILSCRRTRSCLAAGIPAAYISRHAMNRLFERGHDITDNPSATGVFAFIGVLGLLTHSSEKHADGGMHLVFSDLLMAGGMHRFTRTRRSGKQVEAVVYDVRTAMVIEELGDSKWAALEQGKAAASAVIAWFRDTAGDLDEKELAEAIPRLERREDGYPLRVSALSGIADAIEEHKESKA